MEKEICKQYGFIQDGIPQIQQMRHQYLATENEEIIGFASGLTNHTLGLLTKSIFSKANEYW